MEAPNGVQKHNMQVLQTLRRGDLVQFDRGVYSHWGVYVGHGKVIHIASGDISNNIGASSKSGMVTVTKDDFMTVAGSSKAFKNNSQDNKMIPKDPDTIVTTAEGFIGKQFDYNVLTENCEHFATFCRYGKAESAQAEAVLSVAKVAVRAYDAVSSYLAPQ